MDAVQGSQEEQAKRTSSTVSERMTPADIAMRHEPAGMTGSAGLHGKALREARGGFTIIELMISTAVFSLVLAIISASFTKVGQLFYKGVITSKTQETARGLLDDLARNIQFNSGIPTGVNPLCIGGNHYSFNLGAKVGVGPYSLVKTITSDDAACTAASGSEVLPSNMRLLDFRVVPLASADLYDVFVSVAYGDDDVLTPPINASSRCKSGSSNQFCSVSSLQTTVLRRVE